MFTENSKAGRSTIKKKIIKTNLLKEECSLCKNGTEWNGSPLTLQIDHINGINTDNRIQNLRFLCPNCHSQQATTNRTKSKTKGAKFKVSETQILEAAQSSDNARELLLKLNLSDASSNYKRVKLVLEKFRFKFSGVRIMKDFNWKTAPRPSARKVVRPSKDELQKLVWEKSTLQLAKEFGVSDVAIAKWCHRYGIEKPARGYWAKKVFGYVE